MKRGLKQLIINSLNKNEYSIEEVKGLFKKLGPEMSIPLYLKKGDMFLDFVGVKKRPCVIIKVMEKESIVVYFPLSSEENIFNLTKYKSRFNGSGYIQNQLLTCSIEFAFENYIGILEDNNSLNKAIKIHQEFYKSLN